MVDIDANPSGLQPHAGALFEIDPSTGAVRALAHPANTFVDPTGLTEGLDRKIFVADLTREPAPPEPQHRLRVRRGPSNNNLVQVFSADSLFVDPTDVGARADGSLIVTDRDANPFNLPPRDYGAVFQIGRAGGRPTVYSAAPSQYGPQGVAIFTGGDLQLVRRAARGLERSADPAGRYSALRLLVQERGSAHDPGCDGRCRPLPTGEPD